uniref:Serine/threonine-protein kinase mTor n=2 Tax=Drosophila melanogaster TaxID=7227 RepID=TOR_DROME|nr:mechanistic target of rapamycin, isoform A [Drosophila melanogaster]Q9VK45.1 RecName: Full=Serine/threonine-protein kinase mTor; AltName: Full=Target of rapamycin; AltName: Full=mechanistic Target of rapamycin [Drosophila melanogaster]AAF53237.1 mechanistic target of rapamycin, isoform A [Drosophila melanogaster]CCB63099.1 target for rapamycin [Drosophila melanogaster]CCB63100.1 target for rapamycin [Drosophila melanogaster]CCB63101.1 target for rapamycin [Drosophila melanogaster]CCB63102.|eukprot:NP_524891.1 target of rapamycin, isoform A [Drosophila melanogaster]
MSTTSVVQQFVNGLKSRNRNVQNKATQDLLFYVKTELREMSQEELAQFFDEFDHHIFTMVNATDINEKKGGALAMKCLINCEGSLTARKGISPYLNRLRDLLLINDVSVMEIAARSLVKLANMPTSKGADSFDFDIKKAFEVLRGERQEYRRHSAVFILRELAIALPTYFYQHILTFFEVIFNAIFDPKPAIRESAGEALRAALIVTAQRESTKQSSEPQWYRICYDEANGSFNADLGSSKDQKGVTRDDRIHGGLVVFNELFRCANATWERRYTSLKTLFPKTQHNKFLEASSSSSMGSQLNTLVPRLKVPFIDKLGSTQTHLGEGEHHKGVAKFASHNVLESAYAQEILQEHYTSICDNVLEQRTSKSPYVQQALLQILPRLAAFNRAVFVEKYLQTCVSHLMQILRGKEKDRTVAYITIGYMAVAVQSAIEVHLSSIMTSVKVALPSKDLTSKRKVPVDPAVFACITLLAHAVKSEIADDVKDILEQMFYTGLSPALTVCLRELSENVPQLKSAITEGLIGILSQVLMNKAAILPYTALPTIAIDGSLMQNGDGATTVLALKTLGTFNFEEQNMLDFVQRCADYFIVHEQQEIRLEAVQTCTRLLKLAVQSSESMENSKTLSDTVSHVIERLLMVAITDMDCNVRIRILRSLDETFDGKLAQPESLNSLFITLHDEIFEIRELAMVTIGRLSSINPAYVMPKLRTTMIELITDLKYSGMSRNKEQSAKMLDHLVISTPRLISSYMNPILKALVPKLHEPESNPGVILNVLRTIGDLAEVNGGSDEMELWADDLLSILLEMLGDAGSPDKRGVALWTLGQLISATGRVVTPYHKYPVLIDILINFLKTEQRRSIRRETIRVLGLLGAMDPYKHKMNKGLIDSQKDNVLIAYSDGKVDESQDISTAELLVNMGNALDEYYPAVAIAALMRILRDPTLSTRHTSVVQAVTFIFQSLGIKCVPYLAQVLPNLLDNVRTADNNLREFLFQQLAILVAFVKLHIISYMGDIFKLIKEFWTINTPLQNTLINLIEQIAVALGCEFRDYLAELIPQILRVLQHDNSKDRMVTRRLLQALQKFGSTLGYYLPLILPPIVKLFDSPYVPQQVSMVALETINNLACQLDFTDFSSRIIHPLVRVLDAEPELRDQAMTTLRSLAKQLGKKYLVFVPMVQRTLNKHRIVDPEYEELLSKIKSCSTLADSYGAGESELRPSRFKNNEPFVTDRNSNNKNLQVTTNELRTAWQVTRRVSKDDWVEWLKRLSIGLLKESPSHALRACRSLAQEYDTLLRDLFNAAFISCWTELSPDLKNELTQSLIQALQVTDMPEITQTILNLAEFMEHCDRDPIPIETKLLGTRAMACRAYAKALRYKEEEFLLREDSQVFESLILINNKLQQREAAEGLLTRYRNAANELNVQGRWYEKLHNWDEALEHYERNLKTDSSDLEARLGHMRCLEALGDWSELSNVTKHEWENFGTEAKSRAGPLAAVAAWGLQDWEAMREYVRCIPEDTQDGSYYRAVLAVHHDDFETAQRLIDETRDLLDTELTSMAGESYERAYGAMVCVQMLAELEEVIQYKLIPERREPLKTMWWKRLQGGQRLVEDWRRIIQVHSLVVKPHEDIHTWLKYASLCRKSGSLHLSHKTLVMLLGTDPKLNPNQPLPCNQPQVTYAYTKYMAANNQLQEAYEQLTHFVSTYSQELSCLPPEALKQQDQRLMARCYLRMATWQNKLQDSIRPDAIQGALECFEKATSYDPNWYKAWHLWAYMNFKVVQAQKSALDKQQPPGASMGMTMGSGLDSDLMIIQRYAVPAVQGFFRSISLIKGNSLQDTLRLLTLWFDYGNHAEVYEALLSGMKLIEINTWLQVIPQLIARIDTHRQLVGQLIHQLLMDIGKNHPQALVYPLTVASKSASLARRNAAFKILDSMRKHSPTLVEQAVMCSEELIRVAILWHEQWHEGLEEASRLYFGDRNVKGMFEILEPLHAMLERGPQTLKETSFSQAYGRELTEAYEWSQRYKTSAVVMDLDRAWDIYYHVFQKISRQLPQLTSLELPYVSPKLMTCKDLELAVPGSYNPGQELIRISIIKTNLQVITSKQRPRKLCIRGSNGKDYMYLLKGHEDLRQDERVMQLFSLVNTLLLDDPDTFRRNLAIQRYAVIPLSTNSGLIGWVPHCDTLHTLIRDYRDKKKVPLNQEHRTMLNFAPDYDHLTLMQKVEVFEHALGQTQGDDLAKLLWLKSPSSELWFERRNNYTRSLAVMSMVGYILGLGDRHPSNLMLDRMSGKILHIDFGDCFEVAMTREKFPEKIPFRLTRMLIKAMEVTGIEGTYRRTCESVMLVLRRNKDSLMAVLEAFVYDPLLNWRLLDVDKKGNDAVAGAGAPGGRGGSGMQDSLSNSVEDSLPMAKSKPYDPTLQQGGLHNNVADETNSKASQVIKRVKCKLTGTDFQTEKSVNEQSQVELLIQQATNNENLCQCYIGWCPFW